jgi:metal-dependent hydrolase (beta-lactamase superfamily II)
MRNISVCTSNLKEFSVDQLVALHCKGQSYSILFQYISTLSRIEAA